MMMMKRVPTSGSAAGLVATSLSAVRHMHTPGWKTRQSTKDIRSREQREADRKLRQIEKLPRPEALHDFQYPYEKTVIADQMFQPTVYENELDTPHLFNLASPADFFVYWNCHDFDRTDYPAVPSKDHRLLLPAPDSTEWINHRSLAQKYLKKHALSPQYVPFVSHQANLSVVFRGAYGMKARREAEEAGTTAELLKPVTSLTKNNFWFTSHCGNFIELCELQQEPSIFFTTPDAKDDALYTLIIASPDYPYRTSPDIDGGNAGGFFLQHMVVNLPGGHSMERKQGDVVASYVPPLPTEDAGTTRHMCLLFKQFQRVDSTKVSQIKPLTFKQRCNYRMHDNGAAAAAATSGAAAAGVTSSSLRDVEHLLPADPVALTFFQTAWDIHVQEFYASVGEPEPAYALDEEMEAILRYNATDPVKLQVHARHQPDGSTNMGMVPRQLVQWQQTHMMSGSMNSLWSRRTQLGRNNKKVITPAPSSQV